MSVTEVADQFMLAFVLWREARGEAREGKVAVAHSIMTRVKHPCWWGKDLLSVVSKPWQYSSMTDPKDPQLIKWPQSNDASWWECMQVAADVIASAAPNPCPGADSYFDISIPAPKWATDDKFIRQVGRIRFYRVQ